MHRTLFQAQDFIDFMRDPKEGPPPPPEEAAWSDTPSKVHHLSDSDFDVFIKDHKSVLVMFYAPCKYASLQLYCYFFHFLAFFHDFVFAFV